MSKYVLSSFLAASIMAALSLPAFAGNDSGTVNFAGKVVADTCEINVDGSGTTSSTVTFPDTYASDFGTDGAVGTSKTFNIEVKKCDPLVAKLIHLIHQSVKEFAVVRHQDHRSIKFAQGVFQHVFRSHVQMVCGLIEYQQINRLQQQAYHGKAASLTSRQYLHFLVQIGRASCRERVSSPV